MTDLFAAPRPDHSPPENLDDDELARAVASLGRKLRSVRTSLRAARLAGIGVLAVIMAVGFTLLWVGPAPFLARIYQNGAMVTFPELLAWWAVVVVTALFVGIVSFRLFSHRLHVVRGWNNKAHDLERRLEHATSEARRRNGHVMA